MSSYIADFHVPKKRFSLALLLKRFFFLLTQAEKKGFQSVKRLYFCIGQQKQKRTALKEPTKRTAILEHLNRLNVTDICKNFIVFTFFLKFKTLTTATSKYGARSGLLPIIQRSTPLKATHNFATFYVDHLFKNTVGDLAGSKLEALAGDTTYDREPLLQANRFVL